MTNIYGGPESTQKEQFPIAAWIWGHRLRTGQTWIEYMLEFLSILAGYDYQLGRGLRGGDADLAYSIPKRLGLRRFIFYDGHEKTRDSRDTRALHELCAELRRTMPTPNGHADTDIMEQVRSLLRSFSAIEEARSWYAKALFPVHEEFLLWEALRKGSTKKAYAASADDLELQQLDKSIDFRARNFFARGGEIYYLILSAGTEHDPALRSRIGERLRHLLTNHNTTLGKIAHIIDRTWSDLVLSADHEGLIKGKLGWILDPQCALYRQIAEDLDTFLDNQLDSLECLELLAHLISFHILLYIYHRAHPASHPEGHAAGSCLEACRPELLIDVLGEQDGGIMRNQSARSLRQHEDWQLQQAHSFITQKISTWVNEYAGDPDLHAQLDAEIQHFFLASGRTIKETYQAAIPQVRATYDPATTDREALIQIYSQTVFQVLESEFRTNFLRVHRKIGRAIGMIAPHKGPQPRFVLGDTLLKTLIMAILPRDALPIPFGTLLERLYERYGIVIGPGEVSKAGLLERLRINEEYYTRNRDALRDRMLRAGLLQHYSDATALVHRS
ncbi:hypothetical protein OSCT_2510 [Oscillochloris trichoides DG-6]|uniref:Uncharacterized protein n=1 Tax=Oscillochloris trichoides DG-6 TaxID=765420 RepID=E1IGQ9_9CHLR|nr:hypothetical protein [Oscillochloris trichoides]EFO79646.1 hypothetical protein OSCT_2510 [Oscillochloris trichoides DG-6]